MITREPLKVPIFRDSYWVTFEKAIPGHDVARVVELVRQSKGKLPRTEGLSGEAALRLEDECVGKSIEYARRFLG
jgi:hypothetical protein